MASVDVAGVPAAPLPGSPPAPPPPRTVRVAVWGCGHGELDRVFDVVRRLNGDAPDGRAIELLICCGDFQAVRNEADLECMACPQKYRSMGSFYRYYTGEAVAPVTTVFVGGNHEAANHLQELFYGGWVAPSIFYLGSSGVFTFRGLRVAGISGIYKRYNFNEGYYERTPYTDDTLRSVFHVREFDYMKLSLLRSPVDVMVSHDWPEGVYNHGDTAALLRRKRHFADEVAAGALGNPASRALLATMQPRYWFAGHLHTKFSAVVAHGGGGGGEGGTDPSTAAATTRFLALDKCLPGRDYFQVLDVPVRSAASAAGDAAAMARREAGAGGGLCYDPEWLAITARTHGVLPTTKRYAPLPRFAPASIEEVAAVARHVEVTAAARGVAAAPWAVPANFAVTAPAFAGGRPARSPGMPARRGNPQTDAFLALLGLPHLVTQPCDATPGSFASGGGPPGAAPLPLLPAFRAPLASDAWGAPAASSAAAAAARLGLLPSQARVAAAAAPRGVWPAEADHSADTATDAAAASADPAEIALDAAVPDAAEIDIG